MDPRGSQQAGPAYLGQRPNELDILEAAKAGDLEALRGLLAREDADINIQADSGLTALNLAVLEGDTAAAAILIENGADVNLETREEHTPLSVAVTNGDAAMASLLLEHNADPNHHDFESLTPLHIASARGDLEIARLLIQYGAIFDAQTQDGKEALFLAVESGANAAVVGLLLDNGADPDAFYSVDGTDAPTALHLACERGDLETARALLHRNAKVDIRDPQGATPLFRAVESGAVEVVKLLLQRGASTHILREDGQSVSDLAQGNDRIVEVLQSDKVFQGPRIAVPARPEPHAGPSVLRPPPKPSARDMLIACKGFDITIRDFFTKVTHEQDSDAEILHEQSLQKSESVLDVLYTQGPSAIMRSSRESQMGGGKPNFTWFHIPSNNMAWAEHLIRRLVAEKGTISSKTYTAATDELDLTLPMSAGRQNGRRVARMRPHCRQVPSTASLAWSEGTDNMVAFVPLLHVETYAAYRKMALAVDKAGRTGLVGTDAKSASRRPATPDIKTPGKRSSGEGPPPVPSTIASNRAVGWLGSAAKTLGGILVGRWRNTRKTSSRASGDSDLEGQPREHDQSESRISRYSDLPSRASGSSVLGSRVFRTRSPGAVGREGQDASIPLEGPEALQDHGIETEPIDPDAPSGAEPLRPSSDRRSGVPKSHRSTGTSAFRRTDAEVANTDGNLHEHLIQGYLATRPHSKPSLQLRQTLDQYLYSHLESTSHRDDDQVVYRFTKAEPSPKMFMVDQLWMWILGKDTIVTCFPLQWDAWLPRDGDNPTRPRASQSIPPALGMGFPSIRHPSKPTPGVRAGVKNVLIWDPKGKPRAPKPHRGSQRHGATEVISVPKPYDPMSISQNIFSSWMKGSRERISNVYDLASLVATCCVNVFDTNRVPEEFQFFEFFEQSISNVSDKVASRLEIFRTGLQGDKIEGIDEEIELAIEIEDIRDELNILKTVLADQEKAIGDMDQALQSMSSGQAAPVDTKTRHNLMAWVVQMEKTSGKTHAAIRVARLTCSYQLHRLIDLKMNQASLKEAFFARESALDTASQGRTVVVFTLVTIVFLPMSFMAAIFAINTNGFPLDSEDRIPFDYLMKYLVSIGLALSIPFIYVAFNVDTIAGWLRSLRGKFGGLIGKGARQIALAIPALLVVYLPLATSSLSPGIKVTVSIFITLTVATIICMKLIVSRYHLTFSKLLQ